MRECCETRGSTALSSKSGASRVSSAVTPASWQDKGKSESQLATNVGGRSVQGRTFAASEYRRRRPLRGHRTVDASCLWQVLTRTYLTLVTLIIGRPRRHPIQEVSTSTTIKERERSNGKRQNDPRVRARLIGTRSRSGVCASCGRRP